MNEPTPNFDATVPATPDRPFERFDRSMPQPAKIARAILEGFNRHYSLFRYVAQQAKSRFEHGDWHGMRDSARERIDFYDQRVLEAVARIERDFDLVSLSDDERDALWQAVKQSYVMQLADHRQPECAETFFNTVCTKLLHRNYFHNRFLFVRPGVATDYMDSDPASYRSYYPSVNGLRNTLRQILIDTGIACPWVDVERDIRRMLLAVCSAHRRNEAPNALTRPFHVEPDFQIQVLSSLFFRNKGAYIVGRIVNGIARHAVRGADPARRARPALRRRGAVHRATGSPCCSRFTRAYFMVDMEVPVGVRRVPALAAAAQAAPRSCTRCVGLAEAGQDAFLPRLPASPASLSGQVHRRARHQGPGDDGVHAAVVSVRVQGDQGRDPAAQGHRRASRSRASTCW